MHVYMRASGRLTSNGTLPSFIRVHSKPPQGLSRVTITECSLETTEGLEGLTCLTELHLSSNRLQTLNGMKGMAALRKLWANDNRISMVRYYSFSNDVSGGRA